MLNKEIVNKIILSCSLVVLPICAYYLGSNKQIPTEITNDIQAGVESKEEYYYEVTGAVVSPGVFKNTDPILTEQAIKNAGGFTDDADMNYVYKNIKLAVTVIPGEKIYIPNKEEISSKQVIESGGDVNKKINLNFATFTELDAIDGVGEVTANKIISARPFRSCDDIDKIKGIRSDIKKTIKEKCVI